ncbi:MAG: MBL fold metallo-hydrolase [Caldilineaceae bacterium]|nr:MBL fold metallo-hydrolase [Caldilineaceae bacterium]
MKLPLLADETFLAAVGAARQLPDQLHLWWLGQSGFLVQWRDRHLLLDPYLSDAITEKSAQSGAPRVRMTARVVDPVRLDFIDIVASTHNHADHFDPETLLTLQRANSDLVLVVPEAIRSFVVERLGCEPGWPVGLNDGESMEIAGFRLTAVPAAHETLDRDESGRYRYLGYVVRCGPWTLYHSGDTVLYTGIERRLRPFNIDIALLPINGRASERRVAGNLDGREAAELAHAIGAELVIPCHYDMFEFNTSTPDLFQETCRNLGQPYTILQNGEHWSGSK